MKYVPTPKREEEGALDYGMRMDRERVEHVAAKLGLGNLAGQPPWRVIGKILDEISEHQYPSTPRITGGQGGGGQAGTGTSGPIISGSGGGA